MRIPAKLLICFSLLFLTSCDRDKNKSSSSDKPKPLIAVSVLAAGPGLLRVPDLPDIRHVLRRVGRLVPALPAAVEPEPWTPAAAASRSGRPFSLEAESAPLSARA